MASSFVYEADDTEPVDITDRILAIEAEAPGEEEGRVHWHRCIDCGYRIPHSLASGAGA